MTGTPSNRRRTRRLLLATTVPVGLLLVLLAAGLLVVNLRVLPAAASRLESFLKQQTGFAVDIGGTSFFPLRGISLTAVTVRAASSGDDRTVVPGVSFTVPVLRLRVSPGLVRGRLDISDLALAELSPVTAIPVVHDVLSELAEAGLLPPVIVLKGPVLTVTRQDGSSIDFATHLVRFHHDRRAGTLRLVAAASPSEPVSGELMLAYAERDISGRIGLGPLPVAFGPISRGTIAGQVKIRSVAENQVGLDGVLSLGNATAEMLSIANEPIDRIDIRFAFESVLNPNAAATGWPPAPESSRLLTNDSPWTPPEAFPSGSLVITSGDLEVNGIRLSLQPALWGLFGGPSLFVMDSHLPATPVDQILRAVPSAVGGPVTETSTVGTLAWDLAVWVPLDAVADMVWRTEPVLSDFAVLEIQPEVNVYRVNEEFVHTIVDEQIEYRRTILIPPARPASMEWMLTHSEHTLRQIQRSREEDRLIAAQRPAVTEAPGAGLVAVPDPTYRYVYVDDMSPWVVHAILTAEDGDFFFYGGVNPVTLADAIALNVEAGEIQFGASTITMQLAKMLFLDQERVFSRKAQELFLVYLMEHHVPVSKERLLELYINLAEFGPGIFGIHDAAQHYFGKHPGDLTAGEATWLASILPSPKNYTGDFGLGKVSDESFGRMIDLFDIMHERGRMTPDEHRFAITQRPQFAVRP